MKYKYFHYLKNYLQIITMNIFCYVYNTIYAHKIVILQVRKIF